jgi:hypothetical protein
MTTTRRSTSRRTRRSGARVSAKVKPAMLERKHGSLRSGRLGKKVASRKPVIAISLGKTRSKRARMPKHRASKKR